MPKEKLSIDIQLGDTKGLARKLDALGRVTLPVEYRKELNMLSDEKEWVEIFLLEDGLYIRRKEFKYKNQEKGED